MAGDDFARMNGDSRATEVRSRLEASLGEVTREDLRPHLLRAAVFVVAPTLSIVDCGVSIALDDVTTVGEWVRTGTLRRPSKLEQEDWLEREGGGLRALVVQPFVLVQPTFD